ncbi:hypothetical protein FOCG_02072 [Fusarium oxysporum f. sp. radicis-lycopersici 26381]|nr:hypothetical protein FOCG_02072 [Fusarium oxysporum f. sp. radicis-lycopersici 26381]RKL25215.1 hypothetical protein BFJ70_g12262 [Fusarium oxysporum]
MRFNTITLSILLAQSTCLAAPADGIDSSPGFSLAPRSKLETRDSYDCNGSGLCGTISVKNCDDAVNNRLIRNNDVNYGAPGSGRSQTGTCQGACGIFIQGRSTCARTGNQIWYDYQDIRRSGCRICGSKHWGDGCLTTINRVSGCSN